MEKRKLSSSGVDRQAWGTANFPDGASPRLVAPWRDHHAARLNRLSAVVSGCQDNENRVALTSEWG